MKGDKQNRTVDLSKPWTRVKEGVHRAPSTGATQYRHHQMGEQQKNPKSRPRVGGVKEGWGLEFDLDSDCGHSGGYSLTHQDLKSPPLSPSW